MRRPSLPGLGSRPRASTRTSNAYLTYTVKSGRTARGRAYCNPAGGLDNFSYDEAYVEEWRIPQSILKTLPSEFLDAALDWMYAGAAISTALARIDDLHVNVLEYAFPKTTHEHLFSCAPSGSSSPAIPSLTDDGVESPPSSPDIQSSLMRLSRSSSLQRSAIMLGSPTHPESPIYIPEQYAPGATSALMNSKRALTTLPTDGSGTIPNIPQRPNTTLTRAVTTPAQSYHHATEIVHANAPNKSAATQEVHFDEASWERFLVILSNEHRDVRHNSLARFKGYARGLDCLLAESAVAVAAAQAAIDKANADERRMRKTETAKTKPRNKWYKASSSAPSESDGDNEYLRDYTGCFHPSGVAGWSNESRASSTDGRAVAREYTAVMEEADPLRTFRAWWCMMKPKVKRMEEVVKGLEMPDWKCVVGESEGESRFEVGAGSFVLG